MGRKVKCQATGEWGMNDDFFRTEKGYFKSQEVYEKHQKSIEDRKKIISIIKNDFMHYEPGQPLSLVGAEIKKLNFYDNEVILETIKDQYDSIVYFCNNKEFKTDAAKIRYIFAIINNHIADVYRRYKKEKREEQRKKTDSLSENVMIDSLNSDIQPHKQKNKDLTKHLEGDD